MDKAKCAYCGKQGEKLTADHVIPRSLYPASKAKSKVQRLTVRTCRSCNNGWSDDEVHFRNVMSVAGEANGAVRELWNTSVDRSFNHIDGMRRLADLVEQMKLVQTPEGEQYKIYPGQDARVTRILKKVIRGLCYHHGFPTPIEEARIWVDVLKYSVPPGFLSEMVTGHREQDVFQYQYHALSDQCMQSVWLLTFYEKREFIGIVSNAE